MKAFPVALVAAVCILLLVATADAQASRSLVPEEGKDPLPSSRLAPPVGWGPKDSTMNAQQSLLCVRSPNTSRPHLWPVLRGYHPQMHNTIAEALLLFPACADISEPASANPEVPYCVRNCKRTRSGFSYAQCMRRCVDSGGSSA